MAKIRPFDAAEYLDSPAAIADYLSEALATEDAEFVAEALGTVARAVGMASIARTAELSRENLYRALGGETKPEFATIMKVIKALGIKLVAQPKADETQAA